MAKLRLRRKRYPRTEAGDVLTPEVIEALADEAERGYDLSKATRVYVGELPVPTDPRGKIIVRVTTPELIRLERRARAEERPISALVHDAAMRYLKSAET